jgi:hypothetical protein
LGNDTEGLGFDARDLGFDATNGVIAELQNYQARQLKLPCILVLQLGKDITFKF